MNDLFSAPTEPLNIPLPGAELVYFSSIDLGATPDTLLEELISTVAWRDEKITVWGKTYPQPRLVAWFADAGLNYSYSGLELHPSPWSDRLLKMKSMVEELAQSPFNSVLLNYYRHQHDSMGFHSDDERELGPEPVIASLSLGCERILVFKPKMEKSRRPLKLPLASGSLLIMRGETQKNWMHAIEKQNAECGPRVNLTFRKIMT